jgi:cytoskeleton protein RodZ
MADAQQTPRRTVGAKLKQHREAQKLSIQDVAARLRLEPRVIEALEADDFAALPAALYVRGYLRGYAKILRLDPDSLAAEFDGGTPEEPPEIVPELKHPAQRTSTDRPVRAVTYLITLTLALLVVAWWQSNFVVPQREESPPAESPPPPGLDYPITIVRHPQGPYFRAPAVEPGAEAGAAPPGAIAGPATTSVAGGPDRVRITLRADSWVEVFDAGGNELYLGLARTGEVLDLGGQAPFAVLLGYAPAVGLEFNGRPVDPARYSRSGVARFTLQN